IGLGLNLVADVPLIAALLLGSIVATTDPAAVVGIFRDLGAPHRLTRLVEGESLLNDAAAIVLFTVLLAMLTDGTQPDIAAGIVRFGEDFLGGIVLGFLGARLFGAILPFLGGSRLAEVTLALALPYLVYLGGEHVFAVSGVAAVVSAGLTFGAVGRARLEPDNWRYLEQVWEQTGFWAGSLIFVTASILVPRLLAGVDLSDLWRLLVLVVAALLARALAVTENPRIDGATQHLVAIQATGFVLFTLLVNGLTLRPMLRL